jgi:hypothetical protein
MASNELGFPASDSTEYAEILYSADISLKWA